MRRVSFVLAALCTLAGCGESADAAGPGEPSMAIEQAAGWPYAEVGCYIDTPALDDYTIGKCSAYGNSPSIAVFRLFNPTPAHSFTWYGACAGNTGAECAVPISPGQRIKVQAVYVTLDGMAILAEPATAVYYQ